MTTPSSQRRADSSLFPDRSVLAVVIACFNGAEHLRTQLDALAAQVFYLPWELVMSDNGSTDETLEICESYKDRLPLTVVQATARQGPAYARNEGVRHSTAPKLVFLDQDDVAAEGYLASMNRALEDNAFVAATMEFERLNTVEARRARRSALAAGIRDDWRPWAYGSALGVRRELFDEVGGFDESMPCGEDVDFCWRIGRDTGSELTLADGAVLHYRLRSTVPALFRQGVLYGRGGAALYRRWYSYGMGRRSIPEAGRSWAAIGWRIVSARDTAARGEALYLLGNRVGCLCGSISEKTLFP